MTLESLDDIESMKPQSKHSVVLYLYFVFGQFRQAVQILGCYYCLPFTLYLQCICIIQTHSPNIGCSSCLPVSLFPLPLFLLHAAYKYFLIQLQSKHLKGQLWPRGCHVFVYSCPTPLPGQLWPCVRHVFVYSFPTPLPGQLWPRVGHVFVYFCPAPPPPFRPNCILAWRSSLGLPPGGRHRT